MQLTAASLLLVLAVAGCRGAAQPLPEVKGGIEVALRRGAAWSTYTVRPPYIIGPRANLEIRKGKIRGAIDGRQTILDVTEEGISGHSGCPVEVEIYGTPDEIEVEGQWNGSRVHFTITPESIRGTIGGQMSRASSCPYMIACQYVLDQVNEDGDRKGTSICTGLPEETLLEFPRSIQGWLTRNEAVAVLLALFAAPPTTSMEPWPRN